MQLFGKKVRRENKNYAGQWTHVAVSQIRRWRIAPIAFVGEAEHSMKTGISVICKAGRQGGPVAAHRVADERKAHHVRAKSGRSCLSE